MFSIRGSESNEKWANEIMADVFGTFNRAWEDIKQRNSEMERNALRWFEMAIEWVCKQGAGYIVSNRSNLESYSLFQKFIERNKEEIGLDYFEFKFAYGRFINKYANMD